MFGPPSPGALLALYGPVLLLAFAAGGVRVYARREGLPERRRRFLQALWVALLLVGVPLWLVLAAVLRGGVMLAAAVTTLGGIVFLVRHGWQSAEHGIDPDQDIQIRAVPPPEMVANLRADNIDGFLGPDPFNQRAVYDGVGFIHLLSKELWEGHPCCAFAASKEFVTTMPNTYAALLKSIIDATAFALCRDQKLPIKVFSIFKPGALRRVVMGEDEGTLVHC